MAVARKLALFFLCILRPVEASGSPAYVFGGEDIPNNQQTLVGVHLFYVHDLGSSPNNLNQTPEVHFRDIHLKLISPENENSTEVHIVLLPRAGFEKAVDPNKFCENGTINLHPGVADAAYMKTVKTKDIVNAKVPISKGGVYMLVVVQCTRTFSHIIQGDVVVRNPTGFLDGIEYPKMSLYGYVFTANLMLLGTYSIFIALTTVKGKLNQVHTAIFTTVLFGTFETGLYFFSFRHMNSWGVETDLHMGAEFASVAKLSYVALVILSIAGGGFGIESGGTSNAHGCKTMVSAHVLVLTIVARMSFMARRHHVSVPISTIVMATLPAIFVLSAIFAWVACLVSSNMRRSKERYEDEKLSLYRTTAIIGIVVFVTALAEMFGAFLDAPGDLYNSWGRHAFWSDGLYQTASVLIALVSMVLSVSLPGEFQHANLPTGELDSKGEGETAGIMDIGDDELDDEDAGPQADTIGTRAAAE